MGKRFNINPRQAFARPGDLRRNDPSARFRNSSVTSGTEGIQEHRLPAARTSSDQNEVTEHSEQTFDEIDLSDSHANQGLENKSEWVEARYSILIAVIFIDWMQLAT